MATPAGGAAELAKVEAKLTGELTGRLEAHPAARPEWKWMEDWTPDRR